MRQRLGLFVFALFFSLTTYAKPLSIPLWHSLAGYLGHAVTELTTEFNQSQSDYVIKPIYKGSYPEVLTSFVSAFRANKQPPIVQIFEIGTATMLSPKGVIRPVYEIMAESDQSINARDIYPAIRRYYGDTQGRLLAMPFNGSSAVMYVNNSLLKKHGFTKPPRTWPELEKISHALLQKGVACGFASTYPSWIHIESFTTLHGLPFVDKYNGIGHLDPKVNFNSPALIFHMNKLKQWQGQHVFEYGGRDSNAVSLFTSGRCALLLQSSGSYKSLKDMVSFDLGVSSLPYWPSLVKTKGNSALGGAALWVSHGFSPKTYQGVAKFFAFLSKPKTQAKWQQLTGYLPISEAANQLTESQRKTAKQGASDVALRQINHRRQASVGARLGNYAQLRLFNDEQIEAVLANMKTPKQAMDDAVKQGNYLLNRFRQNIINH